MATGPNYGHMMEDLLMVHGQEVTVYPHDGYGSEDNFWQDDKGWQASGTTYRALLEDSITSETLEREGFRKDAEAAAWFKYDAVDTGDLVDDGYRNFVVIEVSNFRSGDTLNRQIAALRDTNENV